MKKTVKIDLREKSSKDLQKHIKDKSKELLELKVKHNLGKVKDTSVFTKLKSEIAYCLSLVTSAK